jgi:ribose-phosphate pyrophosphokinase
MITYKAKTSSGEIINSALEPFAFPAGEAHIKVKEQRELEPTEIAIIQPSPDSIHDDLFHLRMWNNYIVNQRTDCKRVLIMPYFPGARADRGFPYGVGEYAYFINELLLSEVHIFDPHSPATMKELTTWFGPNEVLPVHATYSDELLRQPSIAPWMNIYIGIIAPDKGAVIRAGAVAQRLGIPLYVAGKTRDEATGKLSGFTCEPLPDKGRYLIVDDICDGGGTFIGLLEAIGLPYGMVDLFVSHGVFSKDALNTLANHFPNVFTTNSFDPRRSLSPSNDLLPMPFVRFDVINLLLNKIK